MPTWNRGNKITECKRESTESHRKLQKAKGRKPAWTKARLYKIIQDYTKTEYGIEARQLQNAKVNSSEFRITF